jgi:hypothetical protein
MWNYCLLYSTLIKVSVIMDVKTIDLLKDDFEIPSEYGDSVKKLRRLQ